MVVTNREREPPRMVTHRLQDELVGLLGRFAVPELAEPVVARRVHDPEVLFVARHDRDEGLPARHRNDLFGRERDRLRDQELLQDALVDALLAFLLVRVQPKVGRELLGVGIYQGDATKLPAISKAWFKGKVKKQV
jgi:hypothetical protein